MGTTDHAFFYNSKDGDRVYDADSFSEWLRKFFTTGVFINELQTKSVDGMKITVSPGYCNINGKVKLFGATTELDVTTAHGSYNRIDNVVIERNDTERDFSIKVVTGGATDRPTPPALIRNNAIYQLCIAQITVKAGVTAITQADITDTRSNPDLCGYVAATVKEIEFNQIQEQFDSYFSNYKTDVAKDYAGFLASIARYNNDFNIAYTDFSNRAGSSYNQFMGDINDYTDDLKERGDNRLEGIAADFANYEASSKAEFEAWFAGIKAILDGDVAGKLQNQINELYTRTDRQYYLDSVVDEGEVEFNGDEITTTFNNGAKEIVTFNKDGSIVEEYRDPLGEVLKKVKTTFIGNKVKTEVIV